MSSSFVVFAEPDQRAVIWPLVLEIYCGSDNILDLAADYSELAVKNRVSVSLSQGLVSIPSLPADWSGLAALNVILAWK